MRSLLQSTCQFSAGHWKRGLGSMQPIGRFPYHGRRSTIMNSFRDARLLGRTAIAPEEQHQQQPEQQQPRELPSPKALSFLSWGSTNDKQSYADAAPLQQQEEQAANKQDTAIPNDYMALLFVSLLWGSYTPALRYLYSMDQLLTPQVLTAHRTVISATALMIASAATFAVDRYQQYQRQQQQLREEALLREREEQLRKQWLRLLPTLLLNMLAPFGSSSSTTSSRAQSSKQQQQQLLPSLFKPSSSSAGTDISAGAAGTTLMDLLPRLPSSAADGTSSSANTSASVTSSSGAPVGAVLLAGLELGTWNFLATAAQACGLNLSTATKAAFLTQTTAVFTPCLAMLCGQAVLPAHWVACLAALVGSMCITFDTVDMPADSSSPAALVSSSERQQEIRTVIQTTSGSQSGSAAAAAGVSAVVLQAPPLSAAAESFGPTDTADDSLLQTDKQLQQQQQQQQQQQAMAAGGAGTLAGSSADSSLRWEATGTFANAAGDDRPYGADVASQPTAAAAAASSSSSLDQQVPALPLSVAAADLLPGGLVDVVDSLDSSAAAASCSVLDSTAAGAESSCDDSSTQGFVAAAVAGSMSAAQYAAGPELTSSSGNEGTNYSFAAADAPELSSQGTVLPGAASPDADAVGYGVAAAATSFSNTAAGAVSNTVDATPEQQLQQGLVNSPVQPHLEVVANTNSSSSSSSEDITATAIASSSTSTSLGLSGEAYILLACCCYAIATVRLSMLAPGLDPVQLATSKTLTLAAASLCWLLAFGTGAEVTGGAAAGAAGAAAGGSLGSAAGAAAAATGYGSVGELYHQATAAVQAASAAWQLPPAFDQGQGKLLLFYSALGPGALATVLQTKGQGTVAAAQAQVFYSLTPVWAALLASTCLQGEEMGPLAWVGGGIIISASIGAAMSGSAASNMSSASDDEKLSGQ